MGPVRKLQTARSYVCDDTMIHIVRCSSQSCGSPGAGADTSRNVGKHVFEGATQDGGATAGVVNFFSAFWVAGMTSARPLTLSSDPRTLSKMRDYPPFMRLACLQNYLPPDLCGRAYYIAKCGRKRKAAGRSECQQRFQKVVGRLKCRLCADQCIFRCAGVRTAVEGSQSLVSYFSGNDLS